MKFSGKICFKIVLKVTKKPSIEATLSTEDTFFKKPPGGGGVNLIPPGILELRNILITLKLGQWDVFRAQSKHFNFF